MKLVYAITVSTEQDEVKNLVSFIRKHTDDIIVVQYDSTKASSELLDDIRDFNVIFNGVIFSNDFAEFKNELNVFCPNLGADYILQLDADEMITEFLIKNINSILELNSNVELFLFPRINTVKGITQNHIQQWGWKVDGNGWINYPDFQGRLFKSKCRWRGKVHEIISTPEMYSFFPEEEKYSIIHNKDIDRQVYQNFIYSKI